MNEFVYLAGLDIRQTPNEDLSSGSKVFLKKLHSAPLTQTHCLKTLFVFELGLLSMHKK